MIKRTFEYTALSEQAKQAAREEFQRDRDYSSENEVLKEFFKDELEARKLPNDDVEYSLGYSQGDGVAFYGRIEVDAELLQELDLTDDARMFLERAVAAGWTVDFDIERNHWATHYAHWNTMALEYCGDDLESMTEDVFAEEIEDGEEEAQCEQWMLDAIDELERKLTERVVNTSRELEAKGYEHFDYSDSDEYIDEALEAQGDLYYEDGTIAEEEKEMTTNKDAMVKCPTCGDAWHTRATAGEAEACTACGDYFYVEQSDIVKDFDVVGFIMAYECGGLDDDAIIEGFQHLIDTGMAWSLQGSYGRAAKQLIERGYCTDPRDALDPQNIEFEEAKRNGF